MTSRGNRRATFKRNAAMFVQSHTKKGRIWFGEKKRLREEVAHLRTQLMKTHPDYEAVAEWAAERNRE